MFTEAQIFDEVAKIQYLYGLKREIRYAQTRTDETESVAEHIYGMHILAHYFIPLEDTKNTWHTEKIFAMISWHDMDELENGDKIGYTKTTTDKINEYVAIDTVLKKLPKHLEDRVTKIISEYQLQETIESQFVKAVDKIEAQLHTFCEAGKSMSQHNKCEEKVIRKMREPYIEPFPIMHTFFKIVHQKMIRDGFFTNET